MLLLKCSMEISEFKESLGENFDDIMFPYHSDANLCDIYSANDILKIYMALSSNKTYHTTYCNLLNSMISEAVDMTSIKSVTYGMEITDEKYLAVIEKVNKSKDLLLKLVEIVLNEESNNKESNVETKDESTKEKVTEENTNEQI